MKTKNKKYRDRGNLIYSQARPTSSYLCVYCVQYKAISYILSYIIHSVILYSVMTNMSKPSKNFDFPENEQSFGSVWFEEFPWVYYSLWCENGVYYLPCVLVDHKNMGSSNLEFFYKKPYRTWSALKQHQNAPTGTQKK